MISSYPGKEIFPFSPPLPAPPWDTWLSLSFSPSHAEVRLHASQGRLFFSSRGGNSAGRSPGWQEGRGRRCGKAKKSRQGRAGLGLGKETRATEEPSEEAQVTREIFPARGWDRTLPAGHSRSRPSAARVPRSTRAAGC